MGTNVSGNGERRRRVLSPSQKYEVFLDVTHQRPDPGAGRGEVGHRPVDGQDHHAHREAGQSGRLGRGPSGAAGQDRRAGRAGGRASRDRTAAGDGDRAGGGVASDRGKIALGLTAGPVPARVDADVKAGLLDADRPRRTARLVAVASGSTRLGLDESRQRRWTRSAATAATWPTRRPAATRCTACCPPNATRSSPCMTSGARSTGPTASWRTGGPGWAWCMSASPRCCGCCQQAGLALPGAPRREPVPRTPFPDWLEWKPNRIWGYDYTHFPRARRAAVAVIDVVSRKWLATLVSAEETSTQVEIVFCDALEAEGLLDAGWTHGSADLRPALADGDRETIDRLAAGGDMPLLLAVSDNGPQMRSVSTREFLAGVRDRPAVRPARHPDRPGLDRDACSGTSRASTPTWNASRPRRARGRARRGSASDYNTVRLHAGIGYVTPDDEHEGRGEGIRKPAGSASNRHAGPASNTVETRRRKHHEPPPPDAGSFSPRNPSKTQTHLTGVGRVRHRGVGPLRGRLRGAVHDPQPGRGGPGQGGGPAG